MLDIIIQLKDLFISVLREEWFWAIVAIIITLLSFIVQMRSENQISRANFVYNISNDFANNERILQAYQWLEKCRRANREVASYPRLDFATDTSLYDENKSENDLDFIDVDTYVNHFEVVYVILRSVKIKNIDELFQQRFLSFMLNPYIQKEALFPCFLPDENDFLLLKKWLLSIYARNRFSCEDFIDYMNTYTCGNYELTAGALEQTKQRWPLFYHSKVRNYLINYVYHICDPNCQYGYFEFSRRKNTERKVLRIIRPASDDKDAILALQNRVVQSIEVPEWYLPSTKEEIHAMLNDPRNYACLQICNGNQIVAFACVNLNPTAEQDVFLDLKAHNLPYAKKAQCILETVFVDPDYRGFGMQKVLINVLCSWSATLGKRHIAATIHPENRFSAKNFIESGFALITQSPIAKYDSQRNIFTKKLSGKDAKKSSDGKYSIYPYV